MRILIAGAGTIGTNLAAALVGEDQEVVVIDVIGERLSRLENTVDCQLVIGNALSPAALENLGIRHTDLVLALTENDGVNIAVCQLADFYGVPQKMARVRNPELADPNGVIPSDHFGIDRVISPELLTVAQIEALIACPGSIEALDFEQGRIAIRAMTVTEESPLAGQTVAQVRAGIENREFLLTSIRRGTRMMICSGDVELRIGDRVYVVSSPDQIFEMASYFDPHVQPAKRAMIFGGGVTGVQLARRLVAKLSRVTLIEPDRAAAEAAAEELDQYGVEVLHGSALDEELIVRCGIEHSDYFIATSDDDESNFIAALLFRRYGEGVPIVVTSQPHYVDILDSVDLDIALNPRDVAVNELLRHLRRGTVLSAARLRQDEAEMVELKVGRHAPIAGKPIRNLNLPKGLLIAAVLRDRELHFPLGGFVLAERDRVLVFNDEVPERKLQKLFRDQD